MTLYRYQILSMYDSGILASFEDVNVAKEQFSMYFSEAGEYLYDSNTDIILLGSVPSFLEE